MRKLFTKTIAVLCISGVLTAAAPKRAEALTSLEWVAIVGAGMAGSGALISIGGFALYKIVYPTVALMTTVTPRRGREIGLFFNNCFWTCCCGCLLKADPHDDRSSIYNAQRKRVQEIVDDLRQNQNEDAGNNLITQGVRLMMGQDNFEEHPPLINNNDHNVTDLQQQMGILREMLRSFIPHEQDPEESIGNTTVDSPLNQAFEETLLSETQQSSSSQALEISEVAPISATRTRPIKDLDELEMDV